MRIERGVMVIKDNKAWGEVYSGGHSPSYGWIDLERAPIHDPKYCTKTTDVTYENSPDIKELLSGKLVHVERITTVNITPSPERSKE